MPFRRCMLEPVPQIAEAARLLNVAADAHLAGDRIVLQTSSSPRICRKSPPGLSGSGRISPEIHRYRHVPDATPTLPKIERHAPRMPGRAKIGRGECRDRVGK